jgi:hypothetical protein
VDFLYPRTGMSSRNRSEQSHSSPGRAGLSSLTSLTRMRGMFLIWTGVIVAGLVFFTIVGFTHH